MPVIHFFLPLAARHRCAVYHVRGSLVWLRFTDILARRKIVSRHLSRKLIHIGTGPIFVLCWLLFSGENQNRWLAALVPAVITLQFALIGLGVLGMKTPCRPCPAPATGASCSMARCNMALSSF